MAKHFIFRLAGSRLAGICHRLRLNGLLCAASTMSLALAGSLPPAQAFADQTIILHSGGGAVGSPDGNLHCFAGPADAGFPDAFTHADFVSARSAPSPIILLANTRWIQSLGEDPAAQWVNDTGNRGSGGSGLYAIDFEISQAAITATLEIHFAVDNALGTTSIPGVYVNELPIPGSNQQGDYSVDADLRRVDLANYLHVGTNTLYLYLYDYAGPSGLLFSATITTTTSASAPRDPILVDVIVPTAMKADAPNVMSVTLTNTTVNDFGDIPLDIQFPPGYSVPPAPLFPFRGGVAPGQGPDGADWPYPLGIDPNDVSLIIPDLPPGESLTLKFQMPQYTQSPTGAAFETHVVVRSPQVIDNATAIDCLVEAIDATANLFINRAPCFGPLIVRGKDLILGRLLGVQIDGTPWDQAKYYSDLITAIPDFVGGCLPADAMPEYVLQLKRDLDKFIGVGSVFQCLHFPPITVTGRGILVSAFDPNAIVGERGYGVDRAIDGKAALTYTVMCENVPEAGAAASEVTVRDTLDKHDFDLSTARFGTVAFGPWEVRAAPGATGIDTTMDLRPGKNLLVHVAASVDTTIGVMNWSLAAIDPLTGLPPTGIMDGVLAPDRAPPEGRALVTLQVRLRDGVQSGQIVRNSASIVFDHNPPIRTPEWTNVVDREAPESRILSRLTSGAPDLWTIGAGGSDRWAGIREFQILESVDNGAFEYVGVIPAGGQARLFTESDHTYRVLSVAVDSVGNTEALDPEAAEELHASPVGAVLGTTWPNPSSGSLHAWFTLPRADQVTIEVFDVRGRRVKTLLRSSLGSGPHMFTWDETDTFGGRVRSGVYLIRLVSPGVSLSTRAVVIR